MNWPLPCMLLLSTKAVTITTTISWIVGWNLEKKVWSLEKPAQNNRKNFENPTLLSCQRWNQSKLIDYFLFFPLWISLLGRQKSKNSEFLSVILCPIFMNTLGNFTCTHANVIALFFPFLDFEHTMQYLVCKNYLWDGQNSAVGREKKSIKLQTYWLLPQKEKNIWT